MAAELGSTDDPTALVPGDADAVHTTAWSMTAYGDVLHDAGDGLKRIDSAEGWSGEAADQFRDTFDGEPVKWLEAGDCFQDASTALHRYADTLTWAQQQAGEAIRLWNEGEADTHAALAHHAQQQATDAHGEASQNSPHVPFTDPGEAKRQAARETLSRARMQLTTAGDSAADLVGRARDKAPEKPGLVEQAGDMVSDAAASIANSAASLGNAALNHPAMVAGLAGGAALTAASAVGETAGVVLDVTGVGAIGGAPVNVVSGAGIATGVGMMGAAMAGLASEASGDDEVEPVETDSPEEATPAAAEPPKEISGLSKHGEERAMGRDGHGVSEEAMNDAVQNPTKTPKEQSGGTFKYVGNDATVILSPEGKVVTTWARNSNGWRHP